MDWKMRVLCLTCYAQLSAQLEAGYSLKPDQLDVRPETRPCSRCGKTRPCRAYWVTVRGKDKET